MTHTAQHPEIPAVNKRIHWSFSNELSDESLSLERWPDFRAEDLAGKMHILSSWVKHPKTKQKENYLELPKETFSASAGVPVPVPS